MLEYVCGTTWSVSFVHLVDVKADRCSAGSTKVSRTVDLDVDIGADAVDYK